MCSVTVNRGDTHHDGRVDDPVTQIPVAQKSTWTNNAHSGGGTLDDLESG